MSCSQCFSGQHSWFSSGFLEIQGGGPGTQQEMSVLLLFLLGASRLNLKASSHLLQRQLERYQITWIPPTGSGSLSLRSSPWNRNCRMAVERHKRTLWVEKMENIVFFSGDFRTGTSCPGFKVSFQKRLET